MEFFAEPISLGVIILLVFVHFVSDFMLQTDYMANNKSGSNKALGIHVLVYALPFVGFGLEFALINMVLHFGVDYVTSRLTKKMFTEKKIGMAFKVIGFDQFLHIACLVVTYVLLGA